MSVIAMTGFEHGGSSGAYSYVHSGDGFASDGSVSITDSPVRPIAGQVGKYVLRTNPGINGIGYYGLGSTYSDGSVDYPFYEREVYISFYFHVQETVSGDGTEEILFINNEVGDPFLYLHLTGRRRFDLYDPSGNKLETGLTSLTLGEWYRIDLHVKWGATQAENTHELRINETVEWSGSGEALGYTDEYGWYLYLGKSVAENSSSYDVFFDDFVMRTDGYQVGPYYIVACVPNGSGSYSQFTPSTGSDLYMVVDERPCNADSDYAYGTAAAQVFTVSVENSAVAGEHSRGILDDIDAVRFSITARRYGVGVSLAVAAISGSTERFSDSHTPPVGYRGYSLLYESDFDTGGAWTPSLIDGVEVGCKQASTNPIRVSSCLVHVLFHGDYPEGDDNIVYNFGG